MKKTSPGIYKMVNKINGNTYIGSSNNLSKRIGRHKYLLKKGYIDNIRIKKDADEYGIDVFEFSIIENCETILLKEREQYYYELLKPYYNVWKSVYNASDRDYTDDQLQSFQGRPHVIKDVKSFSEKLKEAWIKRKNNPNYKEIMAKSSRIGSVTSEETKKKISEKTKGIKKPLEVNEKIRKTRTGSKLINGHFIKVDN